MVNNFGLGLRGQGHYLEGHVSIAVLIYVRPPVRLGLGLSLLYLHLYLYG